MREFVAMLLMIVFIIFIGFIWYEEGRSDMLEEINELPSAMDVYQGKTTLQYTIVDGEKVDSVVVFKIYP